MVTNPREPDWPLPESPECEFYSQNLATIEEGGDLGREVMRLFCVNDFWFLVRNVLSLGRLLCKDPTDEHYGKRWMDHPWMFERCRELQAEPDGFLDLWPRGHFKTALITQSFPLWELIWDRNLTFGILTYKISSTGEGFLRQIQRECEKNEKLHYYFPEVFFKNPKKESDTWKSTAITMRADLNPKESSISVWGLVSSRATSQHWDRRIYDDVVVEESVANAAALKKTHRAWENSAALAGDYTQDRYAGTRWHINDTYELIRQRGAAKVRRRDGFWADGTPSLRSELWMQKMKTNMGPHVFASQILNDPKPEGTQTFDVGWLEYYEEAPEAICSKFNVYIFVDPCGNVTTTRDGDYCAIGVIGLGAGIPRGCYYVLDLWRDRMTTVEECDIVFNLVKKWSPLAVIKEKFGSDRDITFYKSQMATRNLRFTIEPYHEGIKKEERIRRLQPVMACGDFIFPKQPIIHPVEGIPKNITSVLIEEEMRFWTPETGAAHDDLLDMLSWPLSPKLDHVVNFPSAKPRPVIVPPSDSGRTAWSE